MTHIMSDRNHHSPARTSVNDFESDDALLRELVMDEIERNQPGFNPRNRNNGSSLLAVEDEDEVGNWMLYEYDEQTTEATTANEEFRRLQVLRSYCALDIQEASIDRLTRTASLTFGVTGAWVCLVDFRRIVRISSYGVEDVSVLPRMDRFACAHAIQYRADRTYVIPDMSQHHLYRNLEGVKGPPYMKFYAAAPLISPEGFRIGTFGLMDETARPEGLSEDEKDSLVDYAAVTVKILADHRFKVRIREKMAKAVAITSHDLVTPLSGLQLSLSLLKEDGQGEESNFSEQQREMIATAETCSSAMSQVTRSAFADLRSEMMSSIPTTANTVSSSRPSSPSDILPDCSIRSLIDRINETVNSMQKCVPFVTGVDSSIPAIVGCDDAKVFQIAVTLLSVIVRRIETGVIVLRVKMDSSWLHMDISNPSDSASPPISWDADGSLLNLSSRLVATMGGEFEYRKYLDLKGVEQADPDFVFRVKIPAEARTTIDPPEAAPVDDLSVAQFGPMRQPTDGETSVNHNVSTASETAAPFAVESVPRKKKALVIDDSLVVRKSIGRALERLGYEVKLAVDGQDGLKDLKDAIFDITLCDFLMPNLDGFDCVQQYRTWEKENRRWFRQRIIGISAHASENDVNRGVQAGMDGFQEKPITFQYIKKIHESLEVQAIGKELDALLPLMTQLHGAEGLFQDVPVPTTVRRSIRRQAGMAGLGKTSKWSTKSPTCLVCLAQEGEEWSSYHIATSAADSICWSITIRLGSEECMRSLKSQNWDAVLVSSHLSPFSASKTIAKFRHWESQNRVKRQSNLILMCSSFTAVSQDLPGAERVTMQAPSGFDAILCTNAEWRDFLGILNQESPVADQGTSMILR